LIDIKKKTDYEVFDYRLGKKTIQLLLGCGDFEAVSTPLCFHAPPFVSFSSNPRPHPFHLLLLSYLCFITNYKLNLLFYSFFAPPPIFCSHPPKVVESANCITLVEALPQPDQPNGTPTPPALHISVSMPSVEVTV